MTMQIEIPDGETVVLTDKKVEIHKSGKFKVGFHLNGTGTNLPIGWY